MGSTLKLYTSSQTSNWELIPNKLLIVDDIAAYLATKSFTTVSNFQYIKNKLELMINVDLSQSYSQPAESSTFKYVSIQNADENIHYYFVKNAVWRSKTCVQFELVMDVLNTFHEGSDYVFKDNTKIIREHKDRFISHGAELLINCTFPGLIGTLSASDTVYFRSSIDSVHRFTGTLVDIDTAWGFEIDSAVLNLKEFKEWVQKQVQAQADIYLEKDSSNVWGINNIEIEEVNSGKLFRNIDKVPENINPILLCDNTIDENIEHERNDLACDWYLLYRNQNTPDPNDLENPVECYLIPSEEIKTSYAYIQNGRIIPSFIVENLIYYFLVDEGISFTLSNGAVITKAVGFKTIMLVSKSGDKLNVMAVQTSSSEYQILRVADDIDYITASPVPVYYYYSTYAYATPLIPSYLWNMSFPNEFNNSGTENVLNTIDKLDRTDSKNIKLIKLPYCPYNFTIVSHSIQVSADWDFVRLDGVLNCLKLKKLNTPLSCTIEDDSLNPLGYLFFNNIASINPSVTTLRQPNNYESKLYNSEFFTPTYYYDSFAFKFELEKCDMSKYFSSGALNKTDITFTMTRTINSRFMFTFDNYKVLDNNQNYSKYLPIARNNEEVLYNVPYVNYIRSGFNYDVKNKNLAVESAWINVGLNTTTIAASLLMPSAPLKVAGVVASLVSIASSVKTAIQTEKQQENSIQAKLQQAKMQTASVSGSDDVDLMSVYAENRLKYLEYEPRLEFESLIFKLFFYGGYASNRMGIPNHDTRINFDYLEGDVVIQSIASIPHECLEELINSFKYGVTYLHKVNSRTNKWDFEQKYENWEKWLIN